MSHHTLSVSGLRCAHCVQILERNLRRIPGVRRVEIRPSDEQVEVDGDPRLVSEGVLTAAVRDSGLHVQRERRPLFEGEEPGDEGAERETVGDVPTS
jgi:copper chaperone CopZ